MLRSVMASLSVTDSTLTSTTALPTPTRASSNRNRFWRKSVRPILAGGGRGRRFVAGHQQAVTAVDDRDIVWRQTGDGGGDEIDQGLGVRAESGPPEGVIVTDAVGLAELRKGCEVVLAI